MNCRFCGVKIEQDEDGDWFNPHTIFANPYPCPEAPAKMTRLHQPEQREEPLFTTAELK